jgi:type 1 fimbria pilin
MKKFTALMFLVSLCSGFSAFADDATTLSFKGKTATGDSCSIVLSSARFHEDNVIALAKLDGNGIPFNLGNFKTKMKKFEMVYLSDRTDILVSLQSDFDPAVHIKLKSNGSKVSIESYELFTGGLSPRTIACE